MRGVALGEGAVIAQVAFDDPAQAFVFGSGEHARGGEGAFGRLPELSIVLGTVPPGFGSGAELTVLTLTDVGASSGSIAAGIGARRAPVSEPQLSD